MFNAEGKKVYLQSYGASRSSRADAVHKLHKRQPGSGFLHRGGERRESVVPDQPGCHPVAHHSRHHVIQRLCDRNHLPVEETPNSRQLSDRLSGHH